MTTSPAGAAGDRKASADDAGSSPSPSAVVPAPPLSGTETTLPPVTISDETRGHLERIAKRRQKLDTEWRDAIRRAVEEGGTLREVGEAAGVSHTAVKFIVYGRPEK